MPHVITKQELVEHLNRHYAEETLLVVDIWSSADVERHLEDIQSDKEEMLFHEEISDKSMDIWADIADEFAGAFDYTTSILNDTLYELAEARIPNE